MIETFKAATDDRCAVYFGSSDFIGATKHGPSAADRAALVGKSLNLVTGPTTYITINVPELFRKNARRARD